LHACQGRVAGDLSPLEVARGGTRLLIGAEASPATQTRAQDAQSQHPPRAPKLKRSPRTMTLSPGMRGSGTHFSASPLRDESAIGRASSQTSPRARSKGRDSNALLPLTLILNRPGSRRGRRRAYEWGERAPCHPAAPFPPPLFSLVTTRRAQWPRPLLQGAIGQYAAAEFTSEKRQARVALP